MDNLAAEFKLTQYRELASLNKKGTAFLVHNTELQIYCVKKTIQNYDIRVYQNLKEHPHPKLARIYDFFEYDSQLVLIEEFINGATLEEVLEREGALEFDRACGIVLELCEVLDHLHKLKEPLIHRDIKPSNIMIRPDGSMVLIDFNISRIFKTGINADTMIMGTAGFAAPEQFGFQQTDARSDIYSTGILLNYLLTGHHPKVQLCKSPMARIISKCTLIDPELRYRNISQLKTEITRCCRKLPHFLKLPPEHMLKILFKVCFVIYGFSGIKGVILSKSSMYGVWVVFDKFFLVIFDLCFIALVINFCNIHSYLPICSSKKLEVRILGCIFYFFVLVLIYGILFQFVKQQSSIAMTQILG